MSQNRFLYTLLDCSGSGTSLRVLVQPRGDTLVHVGVGSGLTPEARDDGVNAVNAALAQCGREAARVPLEDDPNEWF